MDDAAGVDVTERVGTMAGDESDNIVRRTIQLRDVTGPDCAVVTTIDNDPVKTSADLDEDMCTCPTRETDDRDVR